jgi:DNA primase
VESQVEEIKTKLDIVEIINRYVPLKKRGKHYVACCPFHMEKTPSFVVSPELQIYKCFGCGKGGDIFNFVEEFERIDFKEALEDLAKMAGITLVHSEQLSRDEAHRQRLLAVNSEVSRFYHFMLLNHPLGKTALDYVLGRGITLDTIALFRIGFSPSNPQLISQYMFKKNYSVQELIDTGTFGRSQYHQGELYDRFQGRLVFPLTDGRNRILGFSGRILPSSPNQNLAKYINSPETDIYHKGHMLFGLNVSRDAIKASNSVIVTEGEFDMISPFQSGVKNIVAVKGTAFTQEQLQLLFRLTNTLILGLDSDFAGNNAAKKSIELADSIGFDIKVIDLQDKYKDLDEAIKSDREFFQHQLDNALPVWDFIINSTVKSNNPDTVVGKKNILSETLPSIIKISNLVIRSDYLTKIANLIGSTPESVTAEAQKYLKNSQSEVARTVVIPATPLVATNIENLEEFLLVLIFSSKNPLKLAKKISEKYQLTVVRFQNVVTTLLSLTEFDPSTFASELPKELETVYQNLFLKANMLKLESTERHLQITKTLNNLLTITIKNRLVEINRKIAQLEVQGKTDDIKSLELEYNQLLSKLPRLPRSKS